VSLSVLRALRLPGPDAVVFGALQERLLEADWPKNVLAHHACEKCVMMDTVMFNGPRVKVGMASGSVFKKTTSKTTGRADYFGPLLNHAARVKSHAAGGQVLVDSCSWEQVDHPLIRADFMGSQRFKGLKEPLGIYQVSQEESALKLRTYPVSRKSMEADESTCTDEYSTHAQYIDEECPKDLGLGVENETLGLTRASSDPTYLKNAKTSAVHWSSRFVSSTLEEQAGRYTSFRRRRKISQASLADILQKTSSGPTLTDGVMAYLETRPQCQLFCNKEEGELDNPHIRRQSQRRHSASIAEDLLYDSRRGAWSAFGELKVAQRKSTEEVHIRNPSRRKSVSIGEDRLAKIDSDVSAFLVQGEELRSPDRTAKPTNVWSAFRESGESFREVPWIQDKHKAESDEYVVRGAGESRHI